MTKPNETTLTVAEPLKRCHKCGEMKPYSGYRKDRTRPDGLNTRCNKCMNRYYNEYVYPKLKSDPAFRAYHRVADRKYRAANPHKVAAHEAVRNKQRTLKKATCERCGATEQLHMHHPDYSKPLEVVTLCRPCHELAHHGEAI